MTVAAGTRLGCYEVLSAIGAGGMGEVYQGRDTKLGRDVALKVLPTAFARDAERMARFQREAKVLASLNHPNIASIYGLEDSGGTPALVMELVPGPMLAERIESGPLPMDEALRIARQIAEALEYAHERGIVHRDLKPANVKVTGEDMVKVLDFGLAKAVEGDAASIDNNSTSPTMSRMATLAGVLLGTAAYMSPEQAKGKPVDRRADIWAFGCVLYEMLTGEMAFHGETVTDTLATVLMKEPDWSLLPPATPARVRVLLQRCLQKDPKQRLRDIGEARIALDEVLSGAPEPGAATSGGVAPAPASTWRRALPWALFAVAVVVAAAQAFVHARQKPMVAKTVRFEIPPPANVSILAGSFALSPDGRQLGFYAAASDGVMRLWVRSMDSLAARPLPATESNQDARIFWSPDSRYIVFSAHGELKKIDLVGDPAETLCAITGYVSGGSWNHNGVIIFGSSEGSSEGIMRVSANGGPASQLTALDVSRGEVSHVLPVFLPDGRHFLYNRRSNQPESGTYLGSLDATPQQQDKKPLLAINYGVVYVPSSGSGLGQLLFLRDGALMAQSFDARRLALVGNPATVAEQVGSYVNFGFFSAAHDGTLVYQTSGTNRDNHLTWYGRQGKILSAAGKQSIYRGQALSSDGTQAAVDLFNPQIGKSSVWLMDFSRGTTTRFTFGPANAVGPTWSADGKRVLFASNPTGHFDIYQKPADGAAGEEVLLKSNEDKFATSVSRDGRFLLYHSVDPKTKRDLWVLPLNGEKKPFPFLQTAFNEWDGHFSPDGHWVVYVSDESGRNELYVRPFSPDTAPLSSDTGKWQVSYGGGARPQWSKDGKELYYLTPEDQVMAVAISTNPVFQAGTPKLLFQAPPQAEGSNFGDYTDDGRRFLLLARVQQTGQDQAPFNVVLNWQSGLKK